MLSRQWKGRVSGRGLKLTTEQARRPGVETKDIDKDN